jgi:adenylate cyclase
LLTTEGELAVLDVIQHFMRDVERLLTGYQGRCIKSLGDGFLAVFEDVANVIPFAAALSRSQLQRTTPANVIVRLRFSLHLAAVFIWQASYGEEIYGAGVNIGARLISLADPGQIVISQTARQALPKEQIAILGASERVRLMGVAEELDVSRLDLAKV